MATTPTSTDIVNDQANLNNDFHHQLLHRLDL